MLSCNLMLLIGHILCRSCRDNVESCPTCRRPMSGDGTNTLANKMIEEIPHSCKYEHYGCEIKARLVELVDHESKCPERTMKCLYLWCNDEIQIRKFREHAMTSNCTRGNNNSLLMPRKGRSITSLKTKQGVDVKKLLSDDMSWKMKAFEDRGKLFFYHQHYFSVEKTFAFYVSMPDTEADKYLAKLTLKNFNDERKYLINVQSVVSVDSAPRDVDEVLTSQSVMMVPANMMDGFLKWREGEGEGLKQASVDVTIDIIS